MTDYRAPEKDLMFALTEVAGLDAVAALPGYEDASPELCEAIIEQSAQLTSEVVAPTNRVGDAEGTRVEDKNVVVPQAFHEVYKHYVEGGWASLAHSPEFGGQGMPEVIATAVSEMWQSANMAFSLGPFLTSGAIHALQAHASEELKSIYMEKLVSGEWAATMDLTEPQAGSDLAAIRTQAVPEGDHYLITGQKIFITWGDHDMTDNIAHLVLARIQGGPEGVRGISLFLVPKYMVNEDGSLGERNDMYPISVEHKLGIHGSPTCIMGFGDAGGAVGYLVGQEHAGLACMFTMMNNARLHVGLQGVAIGERAYQQAVAYAKERVQGNAPGFDGRVEIIKHADVRRMLMTMKALTEATRALSLLASATLDHAMSAADDAVRAASQARIDLLTPVVKGWCSEMGVEVTSLGVQVHGGMGFVEETGAAQHYRDSRITTIYEGTTGIQANDLIGRKLIRDGGAAMQGWIAEMRELDAPLSEQGEQVAAIRQALSSNLEVLERAAKHVLENYASDPNYAGTVAFNLMMIAGFTGGAWVMAKSALAAKARLDSGEGDGDFNSAKLHTARFYAEHLAPRTLAYEAVIYAGQESTMALSEAQF